MMIVQKPAMIGTLLAFLFLMLVTPVHAAEAKSEIGVRNLTLIDQTRPVNAAMGFAGSEVRRIDVTVWYPTDIKQAKTAEKARAKKSKTHPLVIYSHGSYGRADNAMHLVNHLVSAGYIVAAPDYPLSSRAAYTKIKGVDISDVFNQTLDVKFILDQLLGDKELAPFIDADKIATMGHSLGAVTSYFTSFGSRSRDDRIKATVLLGAGDPVQAAMTTGMGMTGSWHVPAHVPVLFLSGEFDPFALINGRHHSAYTRLENPKYEVMVKGGVHIWFRDGTEQPADGSNPDCALLAGLFPGTVLLGCEEGNKLTTPLRQQEITRVAVLDFLDGYLRGDAAKLDHLRNFTAAFADVEEQFEE